MLAAAVAAAGSTLVMMVMLSVVVTLDVGVEVQISGDQSFNSLVCFACNAAVKLDACSIQSHTCTAEIGRAHV